MPRKPPTPCRQPGCPTLVYRGGYCEGHAKARARVYDRARGSSTKRGYGYRWQKARASFLAAHPLCAVHEGAGMIEVANEVHHLIPVTGPNDPGFWDQANWQQLCHDCHSAITAREGGRWTGSVARLYYPVDMAPSIVPLTIVCGPSGSGKTHYVACHAAQADIVIDLDAIKAEIAGEPWYRADDRWLEPALLRRNAMLAALSMPTAARCAWFIVAAPRAVERRRWRSMLGAREVVVIEASAEICARRLRADSRRSDLSDKYARLAAVWWDQYSPGDDEVVI